MSSNWSSSSNPDNPGGLPTPNGGVMPTSNGGVMQSTDVNMASMGPDSPDDSSPLGDLSNDELSNDAEGVWSPDIEQSFQEALAIYPPCGRRKIILSDEGKMYGRNELIARYIKLRTGKTRTRKQVSSHIQVLARRKAKEIQAQIKHRCGFQDQNAKEKVLQSLASMSSAQIVSATALQHKNMVGGLGGLPPAPAAMGANYPPYATQDQGSREKALQTMASMSSAQIVSASAIHKPVAGSVGSGAMPPAVGQAAMRSSYNNPPSFWNPGGTFQDIKPYNSPGYNMDAKPIAGGEAGTPAWQGRSIAGPKLRLVEFSAFLEQQRDPESYNKHLFVHIGSNYTYQDPQLEAVDIRQIYDKFPEKKGGLKELYDKGPQASFFLVKFWADLNTNVQDEAGAFYGVTSQYESSDNMTIQCSTKVCSFGKQVVEKVETEYGRFENSRFVYRIHRSPMCEYMINFIHKLKHLPEKYMMNSVLENFTILQVVSDRESQETLLCIAYVFEVSTSEHGAQHHIYRLVKD